MQAIDHVYASFVTVAEAERARERTIKNGKEVACSAPIVEAAWLGRPPKGRVWRRIMSALGLTADPGLQLPFDGAGRDVLGVLAADSRFRADDDRLRAWRGTIVAPGAPDATRARSRDGTARDVVLRDMWVVQPVDWRLTDLREFELLGTDGRRLLLRCSKAPLVVAPPRATTAAEAERTMQPGAVSILRTLVSIEPTHMAHVVELAVGDVVDVLGIDAGVEWHQNATAHTRAFRESAGERVEVVGDLPEVRLVLAKVG